MTMRERSLIGLVGAMFFLLAVGIGGMYFADAAVATDFTAKNIAPCLAHPFGTDWMGRDMFARTLRGLTLSIGLGIVSAAVSAGIALILGIAAAVLGKKVDAVISFLIDLVLGIPHILLLILVTVALGRGFFGVAVGIALTHWPALTRVVRAEVIQLRESPYIQVAEKLGKSKWHLIRRHVIPHVLPQFLVGTVLLFPHAVLHESSVTFPWIWIAVEPAGGWEYSGGIHEVSARRAVVACVSRGYFLTIVTGLVLCSRTESAETDGSGQRA